MIAAYLVQKVDCSDPCLVLFLNVDQDVRGLARETLTAEPRGGAWGRPAVRLGWGRCGRRGQGSKDQRIMRAPQPSSAEKPLAAL